MTEYEVAISKAVEQLVRNFSQEHSHAHADKIATAIIDAAEDISTAIVRLAKAIEAQREPEE